MSDDMRKAGWYADPEVAGFVRWWNGLGWSDARKPVSAAADRAVRAVSASAVPAEPRRDLSRTPGPPAPIQTAAATPDAAGRSRSSSRSSGGSGNGRAFAAFVLGIVSLGANALGIPGLLAIGFGIAGLARVPRTSPALRVPTALISLVGLILGAVSSVGAVRSLIHLLTTSLQISVS